MLHSLVPFPSDFMVSDFGPWFGQLISRLGPFDGRLLLSGRERRVMFDDETAGPQTVR